MKALVVGLGSMGQKRVKILNELGIETIGVDRRADRREQAAARFGIRTAADVIEALKERPDIMLVCTWPHDHLRYVNMA
ncbi:MAG: Gfo/Idh/MocA family oxidoreductase [Clostridia bacterium]|nr:Gfo/Idh/MocA family oxidoreductase [Clostridia bacterium]